MTAYAEFSFTSEDGLRLSGRRYGMLSPDMLPLVCLPGLTRNVRDFHRLAEIVGALPGRRPLVAFDYRGRGRSEWAADAATYSVLQEAKDVLSGLAHLGIERAVFVGTSRGALIIHLLAMLQPRSIAAAVLNDAGPRIEAEGLQAIRTALGRSEPLLDWTVAAAQLRSVYAPTFPALSDLDFERMARAIYREVGGGIVADHDPKLVQQMSLLDLDQPLPELWPAFEALKPVPVLVIRGEYSRLLSRDTVERMRAQHAALEAIEVPGQGHAPLLETSGLPESILALASRAASGGAS